MVKTSWFDLFKYPRSLLVSWLGNLGHQTGVYGVLLWAPSLFVLILTVSPQQAAKMMILLSVLDFIGRLSFSWLSESIGRRRSGGLLGFGGGLLVILAGYQYEETDFRPVGFWLILAAAVFFAARRLGRCRSLFRRDLALALEDHRHGLGLRFRRHRQDHRTVGSRP